MRELLDAGMNLPLLLLSTIAFFQNYDISNRCPGDFPRRAYLLYRATLEWVADFTLYPSLANDLFCSFRDADTELQKVFCSSYGDRNVIIWEGFSAFLGRRAEQQKHSLRTDLCDSISHRPISQPPIASRQRSCAACHSVLYCSEQWPARGLGVQPSRGLSLPPSSLRQEKAKSPLVNGLNAARPSQNRRKRFPQVQPCASVQPFGYPPGLHRDALSQRF
ncbi:hypothetical protein FA13DRAFT_1395294 [Coprinellus micaceus]|uniref:Uncharacterized protein n=1 Tax=Coprinellus micaceus TaxID=71717 RepID=A0A4Y7SRM6_COPMI|nr:hypothetical protein FA13DRAFT_1395294 [Coprinellus micaceus]